MQRTPKVSATAIVDAVAFETQKNQFRGNVFGQQGVFIDKNALKARSADFNLDDCFNHFESVHEYVQNHGPITI